MKYNDPMTSACGQFQHKVHAVSSLDLDRRGFKWPEAVVYRLVLCRHEADTGVNGTGNSRYARMRQNHFIIGVRNSRNNTNTDDMILSSFLLGVWENEIET